MAKEIIIHDTLDQVIKKAKFLYTKDDYDSYHFTQEVGERFGISGSAFYQLMHNGKMPSLKKVPADKLEAVTLACLKHAFDKGGAEIVEIMTDDQKRAILDERRIKSIIHYNKTSKHSYSSTWMGYKLIQRVPIHMISDENKEYFEETLLRNINSRDSRYFSIKGIEEELMTDEMYKAACLVNGDNLAHVPEDRKDEELCKATVEAHGSAISSVPEEFRQDLYITAIKSGEGLASIPKEDRTEKICAIAVETNPEMFKAVPDELKSYSMCLQAVEQNAEMIAEVPEQHIDDEMVIRFLVAIFLEKYQYDFVIKGHFRDKEEGKEPLLKSTLEKIGATTTDKKRELVKGALEHTKGDCFNGFLKVQREGNGWPEFTGLVNEEISMLAVKLDIENFGIVPREIAKRFWQRNLK
jgi:hypothetical protein